MAMSVSRTCSLRAQLSTPEILCSLQACETPTWRFVARSYATESAIVSKRRGGAPSAKATLKATHVSSAAPKKISANVEARAAGHAGQDSAVSDVKALAGSSQAKLPKLERVAALRGKGTTIQSPSKPFPSKKELSQEEQQLRELEAIEHFKKIMRSADPFGQPIADSLDVLQPRPAGLTKISQYGSLKEWWKQLLENRINGAKNFMSLLYLAGDDSLPGVTLGSVPWYKSFGWLFKAFQATSTKENAWVAPLRQIALQTYRELNQSVASRDVKAIKNLTAAQYQSNLLRRVKKQPPHLTFRWNLEREVSPTKIVSLRATQYYMGKEEPKFGSRYLVHALVQFDTEQSLEYYGPNGEALHEVADNADKQSNGTIAARSKRVTEYLVIEKRLWYDAPWVFREQKWDAP